MSQSPLYSSPLSKPHLRVVGATPPRPAIYSAPRNAEGRLMVAEPPPPPTVEAARLHRKQRLAASFRLFARYGFDMGGAGHITARDPEFPDQFWVNPAGVYFGHIRVSDLLLVSHDGEILHGDGLLNRAAFAIHSELHKARPDVVAAAHSHALWGKAFSAQGRLLDPLTQDSCAFYGDHVIFADYSGVVLDSSEGARIAQTLGKHKAAILQNHGLLTVGNSVESAVWRYIAMENAAQTQLISEAAGPTKPLSHAVALHTASQIGSDTGSWYSFQPLWDVVTREEPDLFD
ncbi:ribulose-5-phosphate 4-epimerase/fuculose-1-phosphate aldolase [Herbaspirillum sp. Sphag1AN]|uniref:class II aldolase/adducin family protein n=1 Tax=unclassified Herbaspirillum TaxID=2624150 RepID=UPI00160737F9|nr:MULTISPECIES: class II aldolase/adducin family protein [unclassified Herbaspirillum]MBB3213461.1 ribulose-5-phosphate 4-epimerase/fuculose-1-phosphate aldolase [Herbaspirillum sp. Sphag1AN]MBB3246495.1 ribulose-5-phosphate 4-epimerase/fuculose-1-phosphate aldolase [Herbaspirillum sp. Sphag64]